MELIFPFLKGLAAGGSLIIAIGAQNAFVIRQGLLKQHLFLTALLCSGIDACLIALGVAGFGRYIGDYPLFLDLAKYFAIAFLFIYGAIAFKSAFKTSSMNIAKEGGSPPCAKKIALALLFLSLLNPHVYLDTVILLGSIGAQQPSGEQILFTIGAISASFIWFFALTFGARLLAPFFKRESSWKIIDGSVALSMWGMALSLL